MKSFSGMSGPSVASAEQTLEQIKAKVSRIVWFNAVASGVSLTLLIIMLSEMAYFGPKLRPVLTPRAVASALKDVLATVHNMRNVSDDVAFFSDGARYMAKRYRGNSSDPWGEAGGTGRALLSLGGGEAGAGMSPEVSAALVSLLGVLQTKAAALDLAAPGDMLRFLMGLDWRGEVAPRLDRGLASVQYAEVLAGAFMSAFASVNVSAARVQPPLLQ